jgi:hypothetical protein
VVGALKSLSFVAVALLLASCSTAPLEGSSRPMYQAAKRQWLASGLWAGSVEQNLTLPVAVRDLRIAESKGTGEKAKYSAAIAELEVIENMPDGTISPRESAEWGAAQSALDRFFKVPQTAPNNIGCFVINKAAAAAWGKEPASASSGVIIGPLKQAVADLKPEAGRDPCYAAAIDDLTDLESATKSQITQCFRPPSDLTVVGIEIIYLDALFMTSPLANTDECQR